MTANQWEGQYFGAQKGAVIIALDKVSVDKGVYNSFNSNQSFCRYTNSLVGAMSTLFSAICSVWQFWRIFQIVRLVPILGKLCNEYESVRRDIPQEVLPSTDEVYMACLGLLGFIARFTVSHYDYYYERRASDVGVGALAILHKQDGGAISTTLLIKSRLIGNPFTSKLYKKRYREDVERALVRLSCLNYSAENMEKEIEQGYKTICRLGRITGYWKACRVALSHDTSKDLFWKTAVFPQYWLYLAKYTVGFAS